MTPNQLAKRNEKIRKQFQSNKFSRRDLAEKFNLSETRIYEITRGDAYMKKRIQTSLRSKRAATAARNS